MKIIHIKSDLFDAVVYPGRGRVLVDTQYIPFLIFFFRGLPDIINNDQGEVKSNSSFEVGLYSKLIISEVEAANKSLIEIFTFTL